MDHTCKYEINEFMCLPVACKRWAVLIFSTNLDPERALTKNVFQKKFPIGWRHTPSRENHSWLHTTSKLWGNLCLRRGIFLPLCWFADVGGCAVVLWICWEMRNVETSFAAQQYLKASSTDLAARTGRWRSVHWIVCVCLCLLQIAGSLPKKRSDYLILTN